MSSLTMFSAVNTETKLLLATTKVEDSSNKYGQSISTPCVSVYLACPTYLSYSVNFSQF